MKRSCSSSSSSNPSRKHVKVRSLMDDDNEDKPTTMTICGHAKYGTITTFSLKLLDAMEESRVQLCFNDDPEHVHDILELPAPQVCPSINVTPRSIQLFLSQLTSGIAGWSKIVAEDLCGLKLLCNYFGASEEITKNIDRYLNIIGNETEDAMVALTVFDMFDRQASRPNPRQVAQGIADLVDVDPILRATWFKVNKVQEILIKLRPVGELPDLPNAVKYSLVPNQVVVAGGAMIRTLAPWSTPLPSSDIDVFVLVNDAVEGTKLVKRLAFEIAASLQNTPPLLPSRTTATALSTSFVQETCPTFSLSCLATSAPGVCWRILM